MWRLILVTFAFLALAFYELSGGADYAPREGSLQVAMRDKPLFAPPKPVKWREEPTRVATVDPDLVPNLKREKRAALEAVRQERETRKRERYVRAVAVRDASRVEAVLASVTPGESGEGTVARAAFTPEELHQMGMSGAGNFSATSLIRNADVANQGGSRADDADALFNAALETPRPDATETQAEGGADLRIVSGDLVNMRGGPGTDFARVTQLSEGTQVEVLDRDESGWLRLRVVGTGQVGWMADWLVTAAAY
ncbi:SH3 domain-containing protein [Roseovarius spongiae]|uniref:SH3 domain-containing protein n=1 Tax=Roseovarius spongiae TaxID=2320272 RepID=UPI00197D7D37|nr:SH3 domain-containing protein [Roseovarius spongiae]